MYYIYISQTSYTNYNIILLHDDHLNHYTATIIVLRSRGTVVVVVVVVVVGLSSCRQKWNTKKLKSLGGLSEQGMFIVRKCRKQLNYGCYSSGGGTSRRKIAARAGNHDEQSGNLDSSLYHHAHHGVVASPSVPITSPRNDENDPAALVEC